MKLRAMLLVGLLPAVLTACEVIPEVGQTPSAPVGTLSAEAPVEAETPSLRPAPGGATEAPAATAAAPESYPEAVTETQSSPVTVRPTVAGPAAASAPDGQGLSADMLSPAEVMEAERLALGSEQVEGLVASAANRDDLSATDLGGLTALSDRPSYRVLYTERLPGKADEGRAAAVAVYRYDTGESALTKVDLDSREVSALDVPAGYQPPLVPEEIVEAATVARADTRVREALEGAGLGPDATANGLLTGTATADSPCADHRCVRLFFASLRQPVSTFSVVVDLVSLTVIAVEPMPGESPE